MYQFESELAKRRKKKFLTKMLLILVSILVFVSAVYFLLSYYKVNNVYVDGNVHYSSKEIEDMVMEGPL